MDTQDLEGEVVMEALLSSMVGLTVLALLRGRGRDPQIVEAVSRMGREQPRRKRGSVGVAFLRRIGRLLPGTIGGTDEDGETLRGAKVGCAIVAGVMVAVFAPLPILSAPLAATGGFFIPDLLAASRAQRRREEIAASIPDVVELLSVCTRAGLNLNVGLKRVAERTNGPLGEELQAVVRRMDLGASRAVALRSMSDGCGVDELVSLVNLLLATEKFGGRVAESLERLAADTRADHRRQAEEQARRAPVKMLFPLVLLILPAFVLLTIVPVLIGALRGLGF